VSLSPVIRCGEEQFIARQYVLGAVISPPRPDQGNGSWDVFVQTTLGFPVQVGHFDAFDEGGLDSAEQKARGRYASILAQMDPEAAT
jgi:hypothetical protein